MIVSIVERFSAYSVYKLNYQKSELLSVNPLARQLPHSIVPFKWADNGFRYLGVFITQSVSDMFCANFPPLIEEARNDFLRWSTLPLSLAGRINLVKMVTLPNLFQPVPVYITTTFFDKLDRITSKFPWGNRTARIQRAILQIPKRDGGLALRNFRRYYWAACEEGLVLDAQ